MLWPIAGRQRLLRKHLLRAGLLRDDLLPAGPRVALRNHLLLDV
jgi:hypothetical protein